MSDDFKDVKNTQIEHGLDIVRVKSDVSYIKSAIDDIKDCNKETADFIKDAPKFFASRSYVDKVFGTALAALLGFFVWTAKSFVTYLLGK